MYASIRPLDEWIEIKTYILKKKEKKNTNERKSELNSHKSKRRIYPV